MAKAAVKGKNNTLCQLCEKMVPMEDWNIKGHRGKCASDHMDLLITYDHHPEFCCPYCDGPVLLWPIKGPLIFLCDESLEE